MDYILTISSKAAAEDPYIEDYLRAVQLAVNRVMHSFYKHPYLSARFPDNVDAIGCLTARLQEYVRTGNLEMLIDCANYALIESILPSHPNPHFEVLAPGESPDTVWRTK